MPLEGDPPDSFFKPFHILRYFFSVLILASLVEISWKDNFFNWFTSL